MGSEVNEPQLSPKKSRMINDGGIDIEPSKSTGESILGPISLLVDDNDVQKIIDSQLNMLSQFEKTNEMLVNCNALAMIRFEHASRDLRRYTQQLVDMKKDLDSVFRRIRFLRLKLTQNYPEAFKACGNVFNVFNEEEENAEETNESRNDYENKTENDDVTKS